MMLFKTVYIVSIINCKPLIFSSQPPNDFFNCSQASWKYLQEFRTIASLQVFRDSWGWRVSMLSSVSWAPSTGSHNINIFVLEPFLHLLGCLLQIVVLLIGPTLLQVQLLCWPLWSLPWKIFHWLENDWSVTSRSAFIIRKLIIKQILRNIENSIKHFRPFERVVCWSILWLSVLVSLGYK